MVRALLSSSFTLVLFTLVTGCGGGRPAVLVDGYALDRNTWARDQQAVRQRASFDMQCPPEQLSLTVLDTFRGRHARQVGVRGCGRQAVYVDPAGNFMWVMNNESY